MTSLALFRSSLVAVFVFAFATSPASADSASVPVALQAELVAKVVDYDKTLLGRAEGMVRVLVVTKANYPESAPVAARLLNALSNISRISGLPHEDSAVEFVDVASLVALCKARSVSILYVTPGLLDVDDALSQALAGIPILTVSSTAEGVPKGLTLGFDLVGAKPKLLVNLSACRRQGVQLSSDVLKIATVIE